MLNMLYIKDGSLYLKYHPHYSYCSCYLYLGGKVLGLQLLFIGTGIRR